MKSGFRGYNAGCHRGSRVWGVSCNAPGDHLIYGDNTQNQAWEQKLRDFVNANTSGSHQTNIVDDDFYNATYPQTRPQEVVLTDPNPDVTVHKKAIPDLEEFDSVEGGRTFDMFAAQIPAIWPQAPCVGNVAISSKEDGTWWHTLGTMLEHVHYEDSPFIYDYMATPRYCYGSRAIFVDGEQTWISYCTSDWAIGNDDPQQLKFVSRPYDLLGVHSILPSNKCGVEEDTIDDKNDPCYAYRCTTFGGISMEYIIAQHDNPYFVQANWYVHNRQEMHMLALGYLTLANGADPPEEDSYAVTINSPVNCRQYGKQFFLMSSYKPGTTVLGTDPWAVGRIEYNSTRYTYDGEEDSSSTIQALCSPASRGDLVVPELPLGDLGFENEGIYAIALPSVRCYIDNSTLGPSHSHDECWVIALQDPRSDPTNGQIITAQWREPVYRSSGALSATRNQSYDTGDEIWNAAADGTLHPDDVAESNTILDVGDLPADITSKFPSETWEEIRIWCYNRVHNYQTHHSVDLVLFTTQGAEETEVSDLIADFEDDGVFNAQYLNHNIDQYGLAFVRTNSVWGIDLGWICDAGEHYEGSNAALAELLADTQNTSQLELTINVLDNNQYVDFYYWFDNRKSGTRFGPPYAFNELTNFPEVEHVLKVLVNGQQVEIEVITDPDGVPSSESGTSVIDNENLPSGNLYDDEGFYEQWRKVRIPVDAGTNTIRWIVNRKWIDDYGHLICRIDKIVLPPIMTGEDINAVHRWFYDGTRIRANPFWAWARRDEEVVPVEEGGTGNPTDIHSRVSTVPEFITMLTDGRIALGNPHYVVVIKYNEDEDEWELDEEFGFAGGDGFSPYGFIRFTASPNTAALVPDCEDPDPNVSFKDIVSDPPRGVFQILPTSDNGFQLRGVNGTMRDASHYPFDTSEFTYIEPQTGDVKQEKFYELLKTRGNWASRAHAWTVSADGKTRVPHVEVLWRPTRDQPAWPESGPYACPPYRKDFDSALPNNPDWAGNYMEGGIVHYRDPLALQSSDSGAPNYRANYLAWTLYNYIIPRTYCDALSRTPQAGWLTVTDDPADGDSYWEPCNGATPPHTEPPDPAVYPIAIPRNVNSPWGSARWQLKQLRFLPITRNTRILYSEPLRPDDDELCAVSGPNINGYTARITIHSDEISGTGDFFSFPDFDAVFEIDAGCEGYPAYGGCQSC